MKRKPGFLLLQIPVLAICLLLFISACAEPPLWSFEKAKASLKAAEEAGAKKHALKKFHQAESLYHEAELEMARQKGKIGLFRSYKNCDSLLLMAHDLALQSQQETDSIIADAKARAEELYDLLIRDLNAWREALDGSLNLFAAEAHWSAANIQLKMAADLIGAGEYFSAMEPLERGRIDIELLAKVFANYANDEADKIAIWRRWVRETIEGSRRNKSYAVIVDKSAHKLYLIKDGILKHSFDCDLGYNSSGQKYFSGDGATPEGQYKVSAVKHNSKYYKALLLDYPTERDKRRFQDSKARGLISKHARIGGLIEIHGDGGRDADWTEGCVAITNKEMDRLLMYVDIETPVTIVRKSDRWP